MNATDRARLLLSYLSQELDQDLRAVLGLRIIGDDTALLSYMAATDNCRTTDEVRVLVKSSLNYHPEYGVEQDGDFCELVTLGIGNPQTYALFTAIAILCSGLATTVMIHCASFEDGYPSCSAEFPCQGTDEADSWKGPEAAVDINAELDKHDHGLIQDNDECFPLALNLDDIVHIVVYLRGEA